MILSTPGFHIYTYTNKLKHTHTYTYAKKKNVKKEREIARERGGNIEIVGQGQLEQKVTSN